MSRQDAVIAVAIGLGLTCFTAWATRARHQVVSAGFWFENISSDSTSEFAKQLGEPITPTELAQIQSIARAELKSAFSSTRLLLLDSRSAMYRVRVVPEVTGGPRSVLPVAGVSRVLPGRRGVGALSFSVIARSAISYAPTNATRQTIIEGIGRGVGRSAAHEFAHQILRNFPLHNTTDRLSYEYADVRPEHFYGDVHWSVAEEHLQDRIGPSAVRRTGGGK